jgi:hypothetical protein
MMMTEGVISTCIIHDSSLRNCLSRAGSDGASPDSTARIRWAGLPTEGRCSSVSASAADMFMNDAE